MQGIVDRILDQPRFNGKLINRAGEGTRDPMEIRYMILARYAEYSPDGKLTLIGGDIDKYVWDEFPVVQTILFGATRLVLNREDTRTSHRIKSRLSQNGESEVARCARAANLFAMLLATRCRL